MSGGVRESIESALLAALSDRENRPTGFRFLAPYLADALLPVVERVVAEARAEALRKIITVSPVEYAETIAQAEQRGAARVAAGRVSRSEIERALKAADAPEDSMATEEDLIRYEGRAEAVEIMRDMLRAALAAGAAERVRAEEGER